MKTHTLHAQQQRLSANGDFHNDTLTAVGRDGFCWQVIRQGTTPGTYLSTYLPEMCKPMMLFLPNDHFYSVMFRNSFKE